MLRLDSSVGGLEFFAPGCLAGKKKCLSILALSAELERAEIFEPGTFGDIRSCLQPDPETVEVVEAHVTVVHAFDQMIANGCGDAPPGLDLGHYSPKTRRPTRRPIVWLVADRWRLESVPPARSKLSLSVSRFHAEFNELHQNTVVAQALALCHALYLLGDGGGERHAPPEVFRGRHGITTHQFGAFSADANSKSSPCGKKRDKDRRPELSFLSLI